MMPIKMDVEIILPSKKSAQSSGEIFAEQFDSKLRKAVLDSYDSWAALVTESGTTEHSSWDCEVSIKD